MLDLSHHALSITYLILWTAVFARQICLPVPTNLFFTDRRNSRSWWRVEHEFRTLCRNPWMSRWRPCLVRGRPSLGQPDHANTLCL